MELPQETLSLRRQCADLQVGLLSVRSCANVCGASQYSAAAANKGQLSTQIVLVCVLTQHVMQVIGRSGLVLFKSLAAHIMGTQQDRPCRKLGASTTDLIAITNRNHDAHRWT